MSSRCRTKWLVPSLGRFKSNLHCRSRLASPGPATSTTRHTRHKFMALTFTTSAGPQVFVVPFPGGNGMWQVSVDGGHWPRWRRDGKELYFVSPRNVLTAVDIREKGDSLEVGHPVPLFPLHLSVRTYRQGMIDYDTSLDGKRFLLNAVADENTRPLTLVVNW